jgi:NitT/TauT family transport system permease protein
VSSSSATESPLAQRKVGPRRAGFRLGQEIWLPVATIAALVLVWELACRVFKVPVYLLPSPSAIWLETSEMAGAVAEHSMATLGTVFLGFVVSVLISLPLAVALTSSRAVANAIYPLLVLTQSIPKVALAPILVVILGSNELPRVVITFLVAFFPLVLSMAAGLLAVPPELIELGRACKA